MISQIRITNVGVGVKSEEVGLGRRMCLCRRDDHHQVKNSSRSCSKSIYTRAVSISASLEDITEYYIASIGWQPEAQEDLCLRTIEVATESGFTHGSTPLRLYTECCCAAREEEILPAVASTFLLP